MRVLGIGKETSFKSGAVPDLWLDLIGHSVSVRRENLFFETACQRVPIDMLGGPYVVEGDIDLILTPSAAARLLYLAMGALEKTGVDDEANPVAYCHFIRVGDQLPTAEFDLICDGQKLTVTGAVVRRLELSFVARELVGATVGILGAHAEVSSESATQPPFERPFFPSTIKVKRNGEEIQAQVQAVRITLENSVADDAHVLGSLELPKMFTQGVEVTGEIEWQFSDWSEYQRFLGSTTPIEEVPSVNYQIEVKGDETGSSVYPNYDMILDFPNSFITESDVHFTRRERVVQRIAFKALLYRDWGIPMKAMVCNTRSEP